MIAFPPTIASPTTGVYQVLRNFSTPDFHSRTKGPDGFLHVLCDHHVSLTAAQNACKGRSKGSKLAWTHSPAVNGRGEIWEGTPNA